MSDLTGMPISSLPVADSIQDGDELVLYRPSTGKAYQANTDLIDSSVGKLCFTESTWDAFMNKIADMNNQACAMIYVQSAITSVLTNGELSLSSRGVIAKMDNSGTYFDFILYAVQNNRGVLFSGRYNNGLIACDKFTGTSVL